MTEYSTVASEAPAFSCRSIVMRSPYWSSDIESLVAVGTLLVADSAADIVTYLDAPVPGGDAAKRMYGVGEPEPDFGALIETVSQRL